MVAMTAEFGESPYVMVTKEDVKQGTLWIEGRLRDDIFCDSKKELKTNLEAQLSCSEVSFELWDDILANPQDAADSLGAMYHETLDMIKTLKIVEYVGPKTESATLTLSKMCIKVQIYEIYDDARTLNESEDLPQAETTSLPHMRFEGKWDELIFDNNLKTELIWMIYNILRFSAKNKRENAMNPLVLLHGPPGMGKTSLAQALAQKISVRLGDTYKTTKLLEIKTATLLSKYFSQSAKQVEEIFRKICQMCEDSATFVVVIVDEVESIAASRERTTMQGEAQDSLRATNALLTGIDRLKDYPNMLLICTSNFVDSLDAAFLDRCALKQAVIIPSRRAQYAILRGRIQSLIDRGVIQSDVVLPTFDDAEIEYIARNTEDYGYKVLEALDRIRDLHFNRDSGLKISGRSLAVLPQTAILRFLREEECDLDMAFGFFKQYVLLEEPRKKESDDGDGDNPEEPEESRPALEIRGKKRKITVLLEEECDANVLREFLEHLTRSENASVGIEGETEQSE